MFPPAPLRHLRLPAALAPTAVYTATVATGAQNLQGTGLVNNYTWTFTTAAGPDTTPADGYFNHPGKYSDRCAYQSSGKRHL